MNARTARLLRRFATVCRQPLKRSKRRWLKLPAPEREQARWAVTRAIARRERWPYPTETA